MARIVRKRIMKRLLWRIKYIYHVRKLMPYIGGKTAWRMSGHTRSLYLMGYSALSVAKFDKEMTEREKADRYFENRSKEGLVSVDFAFHHSTDELNEEEICAELNRMNEAPVLEDKDII